MAHSVALHLELLLSVYGEPYGMLGTEHRWAVCKANSLPPVLSFHLWVCYVCFDINSKYEHIQLSGNYSMLVFFVVVVFTET